MADHNPKSKIDMTPERWQQVKAIFERALERVPDECVAFLDQACDDDEALRREVLSLLSAASQDLFGNTPRVAFGERRAESVGRGAQGDGSFRSPLFALRSPRRGFAANAPFSMKTKQLL